MRARGPLAEPEPPHLPEKAREIEITPEMIEAGYDAWLEFPLEYQPPTELKAALRLVFLRMWAARPL